MASAAMGIPSTRLATRLPCLMMRPQTGVLLLGTAIGARDDIHFPWHRIYGPHRLKFLLADWKWLGCVWDGDVVERSTSVRPTRAELRAFCQRAAAWLHTPPMKDKKPACYQPVLAVSPY